MPFGVGEESRVHPAAAANRGWSWGVAKSVDLLEGRLRGRTVVDVNR